MDSRYAGARGGDTGGGSIAWLDCPLTRTADGGVERDSASFGGGGVGDEALAVGLHAAATAASFAEAVLEVFWG
jgi:hypothetical protein